MKKEGKWDPSASLLNSQLHIHESYDITVKMGWQTIV